MKKPHFYLKSAVCFLFLCPVMLLAQPFPSGYMPFHDYLVKHQATFQLGGNTATRQPYLIYREIAFLHDTVAPIGGGLGNFWTYSDSSAFIYDTLGYETNDTDVLYTGTAYNWIYNSADTYIYDANRHLISITGQTYNNGTWTNSYNYAYTNNNGQPTSEVYSVWNAGASNFAYVYNYNYTYTGTNLTGEVYQNWTGSTWQNDTQYIYYYNNAQNPGQITQSFTLLWNTNTFSWDSSMKQVYNYDANGNNFSTVVFAWNGSEWFNYGLITQSFNQVNSLVSYTYTLWDSTLDDYVNSYQEQYDYNYLFDNTSFENYNWNANANAWVPMFLYTYTYDQDGNNTYEVDANYINNQFTQTNQYYYYYDTFEFYPPAGIIPLANELNAQLFPNPGNGKPLILKMDVTQPGQLEIGVFDAQGRKVYGQSSESVPGENTFTLNLPDISAGDYYVQLTDIISGKMSVLKFVRD